MCLVKACLLAVSSEGLSASCKTSGGLSAGQLFQCCNSTICSMIESLLNQIMVPYRSENCSCTNSDTLQYQPRYSTVLTSPVICSHPILTSYFYQETVETKIIMPTMIIIQNVKQSV